MGKNNNYSYSDVDDKIQSYLQKIFDLEEPEQPHDLFFKWTLGRKPTMVNFLEIALPAEVIDHFKINSINRTNDSYVEEIMKETITDVVYEAELADGSEGNICILFEHKSTVKRRVILKVMKYLYNIYNDKYKNQTTTQVLPIIFYHGQENWTAPKKLSNILEGDIGSIEKFTPDFEYFFIHLKEIINYLEGKISPEGLSYFRILDAANAENEEAADEKFQKALDIFKDEEIWSSREFLERVVTVAIIYLAATSEYFNDKNTFKLAQDTLHEGSENLMTFVEEIMKEGEEKGIEKGLERGIERGIEKGKKKTLIETLLVFASDIFSLEDTETLENKLEEADIDTLENIRDNILSLDSINDVYDMLE
ncbi:Rpn family recombination-promoting nuclease/putative transposase [Halarsenatibacter silvermanii]|uniref:Transposase (putative) YhgA-like domain-containing protein n=1 Tax=Halarsenatibacter silvermanii TaxID=321763 RepID=A0A1G9U9J9_9FIRM|nr:Rpn family recombination-promoting nuclease/putative transposase [Halarsenatibacter silvermanii]SDM56225.1 conserved hypothetical protein (putative transposase or invertase) [Halarsenatibacter silvermanii]